MADQIQRRRGTTAEHSTFTGAIGEVTVDTDKNTLVVHDNSKAGGYPAARESTVEGRLVIDFATDADYTLTAEQARNAVLVFTDTGTVLTTGRNVILPTDTRILIVENDSAQTLTFKTSAGTGKAVTAGRTAFVRGDGTNVVSAFDELTVARLAATAPADFSAAGAYFGGNVEANLLDDYEEGTFTPVLLDDSLSSSKGQTYLIQIGNYTKIGNTVVFQLVIRLSNIGTLTGANTAKVGGLPFIAATGLNSNHAVNVGHGTGLNLSAASAIGGYILSSGNYIELTCWDSVNGVTGLVISEFSSSGYVMISGHYKVQ